MDFEAALWKYDGEAAWWFVTVPPDVSEDLRMSPRPLKGFGSIRVEVNVGGSTWRTSVFPDKASGCFVLPVKKTVREAEGLEEGDPVQVRLAVVTDE